MIKRMKLRATGILVLTVLLNTAFAQSTLTIQQAIELALKNNYDILVAHNDAEVANINNSPGNAGMLPTVGINVQENLAINNFRQEYSNTAPVTKNNAIQNALNPIALTLNWTLFDGAKMFITKHKLEELKQLGELQLRDKVMQTTNDVVLAFYDVVRQRQQLQNLLEIITYNEERVKISSTRFDAGLAPKTDLLQAKIDQNVNRENAMAQQIIILNAKRKLNQLLSREPDVSFDILDTIPLNYAPDKAMLLEKLYGANISILAFQKQADVSNLVIKEARTQYYPKLNLIAGYNFLQNNNSVGSIVFTRAYGPQIGGTLAVPLYQSGSVIRQVKIAKIQAQSATYNLERTKLQSNIQLQNALSDFENQEQLLKIEQDNKGLSKENLDISIARLRLGQTNSLEMSQAQLLYETALTRLLNIQYNLKAAETKIKQLLGQL